MPVRRLLAWVPAVTSGGLTAFFLYAFHTRYWRLRDCFNAEGNCWNSAEAVNYTTSGFVWILPTLACAVLTAAALARRLRPR